MRLVWDDQRLGWAVAVAAPVLWGLAAGWWTPRGPLTTFQVLSAMAIGLAVGAVSGLALRSRWAMAVAPVAFVVVFELMRMDAVGPTVDAPALSTYGFLALAVGRGFHGVVALVPMVLGAVLGAAAARRLTARSTGRSVAWTAGRYVRTGGAVLTGTALLVLVALVARPAATGAHPSTRTATRSPAASPSSPPSTSTARSSG